MLSRRLRNHQDLVLLSCNVFKHLADQRDAVLTWFTNPAGGGGSYYILGTGDLPEERDILGDIEVIHRVGTRCFEALHHRFSVPVIWIPWSCVGRRQPRKETKATPHPVEPEDLRSPATDVFLCASVGRACYGNTNPGEYCFRSGSLPLGDKDRLKKALSSTLYELMREYCSTAVKKRVCTAYIMGRCLLSIFVFLCHDREGIFGEIYQRLKRYVLYAARAMVEFVYDEKLRA